MFFKIYFDGFSHNSTGATEHCDCLVTTVFRYLLIKAVEKKSYFINLREMVTFIFFLIFSNFICSGYVFFFQFKLIPRSRKNWVFPKYVCAHMHMHLCKLQSFPD